jgi:hypothetical protein
LLGAWIIILTGLIGVIVASPGSATATAGINNTLNFQGRLLSASGAVVPDGNYNMEFRIYQDGTGTAQYNGGTYASPTGLDWSEDWLVGNSQGVSVKNGYFSVNLGSICPLGGSTCQGQVNSGVNWNDTALWVSMDVANGTNSTASCATTQSAFHSSCTPDGELLPMRSVATAIYAESAAELGGIKASGFIQNTASPQTGGANIDYVSKAAGNIGAQIQSAVSGTAAVLVLKDNTSSTGDLLQLQPSGSTTPLARFDDAGNLYLAGIIDAQTSGGSLSIGPTNSTGGITLGQDTTVATGKSFTVAGGATTLSGTGSGTVAVAVQTGADTNKGLVIEANSATQSADLLDLYNQTAGSFVGGFGNTAYLYTNGYIKSGTTSAVGALVVKDGNANGYTGTLEAQNQTGTYSLTLPTDGVAGNDCLQSTSGSTSSATSLQWASCSSSGGAATDLSNLSNPTAINQDLTFAAADRKLTIAQSGSTGNTLSVIAGKGASGSTGGNLYLQGGANGTGSGTPGSVDVRANGADSTTSFEVQDASANNILAVDSTPVSTTSGGSGGGSTTLGSWSTGTAAPAGLYWNTAASYNGYAYILGGVDSSYSDSTAVYYHAIGSAGAISGSWTTDTAEPLPAVGGNNYTAGGCSVAYNGYIYFMGGYDEASTLNDTTTVFYASLNSNGSLGTWGTTTALTAYSGLHDTNGMDSAGCFEANGYMYFIGGEDDYENASAYSEYAQINSNGTLGSWTVTPTADELSQAEAGAAVVEYNNYVYVMGGESGALTTAYNTVQVAQLNTSTGAIGTWSTSTHTAPLGASTFAATAAGNNEIFYIGGATESSGTYTYYSKVYEASISGTTVGAWTQLTSDSVPTTLAWGGYTTYNGYVYLLNGTETATSMPAVTYYALLPSANALGSWTSDTHTVTATVGENATTGYNGYIYSLGGLNSSDANVRTVEYASVNSDGSLSSSWSTTTQLPQVDGGSSPSTSICNSCASPLTATAGGCALAYNGYIYFIDGADNAQLTDDNAVLYAPLNSNGTVGTWAATTGTNEFNGLSGGMDNSGCVIANGYIYIAGGENDPSGSSTDEIQYAKINSNGTVGSWTTSANTYDTSTGTIDPAIASDGSYIYVMGGWYTSSSTPLSSVNEATLNASTGAVGSWTAEAHTLTTAVSSANAAIANGTLFIAGGITSVPVGYDITGSTTAIATTYQATLTSGTVGAWSNASDNMPGNQGWGGSAIYNGYLYAIGGTSGGGTLLNKVYYAGLPGGSPTTTTYGQGTVTIEGALTMQNTSSATIFNVSPVSKEVSIGAGSAATDSTAVLLVLDNQASSARGDPTEVNGAMYYNAAMGAFRCGQGGNWDSCANSSPVALSDTTEGGNGTYTTAINRVVFMPLYVPGQMTVNDFYFNVTTAFTTSGDVGLYNSAGTLVLDTGSNTIPTSVTGLQTVAPSQTGSARVIAPGQYYLAWTAGSAGGLEAANLPVALYKGNGNIASIGGSVLPSSVTVSSISAGTSMPIMAISN